MVSVLITRPQTPSELLAQSLAQHGYAGVIEPLLAIVPTDTPRPALPADAVMLTSANAISVLEQSSDISGLTGKPCFCVGARTADKAESFGFQNVRFAASDGIELAQLIAQHLKPKKTHILHIGAAEVDSKAQDALRNKGFAVTLWPVYEAQPVGHFSAHTLAMLKKGQLDAVLVFSARTAQTLATLIQNQALEACCHGMTAIGLSEAVADMLKNLPWQSVRAALHPTEESVIDCLIEHCPAA